MFEVFSCLYAGLAITRRKTYTSFRHGTTSLKKFRPSITAASFGSPQNIANRPFPSSPPFLSAAVAAAVPDFAAYAPGSGNYPSTSSRPIFTTTQYSSTGIAASPGNYPVPVVAESAGPDYFEADIGPYPPPVAGKDI